ncbi:MAG: hypothetical protein WEA58_08810 [Balneolaceae bacterium]
MKYFIGFIFLFIISSCDDVTNQESNSPIQSKVYIQQAQQTSIENEPYSASRVSGYLQKKLHFFEADSMYLEINSDIVSENGRATAMYSISDQKLTADIIRTTTTYYELDSSLIFDPFETVDESYTETIKMDSDTYHFKGPGIILQFQEPDLQDLDQDNDTSEMVLKTEYYSLTTPED